MGILDAPGVTPNKLRHARRLAALVAPQRAVVPAVHPSPPTLTESTSATLTSNFVEYSPMQGRITKLGATATWNSGSTFVYNSSNGGVNVPMHYGFQLVGDTVEIIWRAQLSAADQCKFWIFVDGKPITAQPTATTHVSVVAGTAYYLKLVFAEVGSYDIRVYTVNTDAKTCRIPASATLNPVIPRPWKIACVGDSYGHDNPTAGSDILTSWPKIMCDLLNAECIHACQPGTGYVADGGGGNFGAFTDARRVASIVAASPDLIVFFAGCNDRLLTPSTVGAAATAIYGTLATQLPTTPIAVIGVQPLEYVASAQNANVAQVNAAIRTAALAAPNAIGFADALGTATLGAVPADYTTSVTYAVGDVVKNLGTVYRCIQAVTASGSPQAPFFEPVSWYSGTGNSGSAANNGNRDTCLYSDLVHPTLAGQRVLGSYAAKAVADMVRTAAA